MSAAYRYLGLLALVMLAACPPDNGVDPVVPPPPPPPPPPPLAPSNLTATAMSSSHITVSWTDGGGERDGILIERCAGAGCNNFAQVLQSPPQFTSYFDIDRAASTSYSYRVRAVRAGVFSTYSNTATAITAAAATSPAAPSGLSSSGLTSSQVDLLWTDNAGNEDGFKIERCQGAGCTTFSTLATLVTPNSTSYRSTGLVASTTYRYRVLAYNGAGASTPSAVVTITTLPAATAPAAPGNFLATATSGTQVTLTWTDLSNNEDGFRIEVCSGAACSNYTSFATAAANATSLGLINLTPGTTYNFRIHSFNGAGTSAWIGPVSVTTPAAVAPPTGFAANPVSSTQINLTWTDASNNEDGFRIERCTGATCTNYALVVNTAANASSYSNTGLTAGTTYRYRIQAFNAMSSSTAVGPVSATTSAGVTAPAAPTGLGANVVSSSRIDLTWTDASSNEESFRVDRCTGASCTSFIEVANLSAGTTTYQNTGLSASTTYGYRVRSVNSAGTGTSTTVYATSPAPLGTPTLNTPSVSGTSVTLTWTFTWPGGLASSQDHYDLEVSTTSSTAGFSVLNSYFERTTPKTVTLTRAAGTHWFRVRAFTTQGTTNYSTVQSATVAAANRPTTLRIVNDLPGIVAGPNDWGKLNTVIRVRVGPTSQSVINFTSEARELLYPLDYTSSAINTIAIPPGSSMTLDVSSQPGPYWLYIQTGWWEYFVDSELYEKHMAVVVACNGVDSAYKWRAINIIEPFGNPEEIRLSQWLPQGNWYASPFC